MALVRRQAIIAQVQFEALLLSLLGVVLGLVLAYPLITYLTGVGIPLGQMGGEEAIRQMQMGSIERIYPKISLSSATTAPLVIVGTQLAALVSTVRVQEFTRSPLCGRNNVMNTLVLLFYLVCATSALSPAQFFSSPPSRSRLAGLPVQLANPRLAGEYAGNCRIGSKRPYQTAGARICG